MHANHQFPAIFDENSKILILGSFPSVKSRELNFFYMHTQNRFWKVIGYIYNINFMTLTIEEKKEELKRIRIALYDVIEECDILNSSDSSIKNVIPIDLEYILNNSKIKKIYLNGKKAYDLFCKYFPKYINIATLLLSTSPANAKYSLDDLIKNWNVIKAFTKEL